VRVCARGVCASDVCVCVCVCVDLCVCVGLCVCDVREWCVNGVRCV